MSTSMFGLLELGSNSLKHYRVEPMSGRGHRIETRKIPWRIAHDFFTYGELREETVDEVIEALSSVARASGDLRVSGMLCLATGVFREIPDLEPLARRVRDATGLRIRVISGDDEAKLMGKSFRHAGSGSIAVADLGGATTEWVWLQDGQPKRWGSLPLGAIRIYRQAAGSSATLQGLVDRARELCAVVASKLVECAPCELLATGGTAKALAQTRGSDVTRLDDLTATIRDVQENGPPSSLKPNRKEVYLSGLIILEQLAVALGVAEIAYARASVKEGMAQRLVSLLAQKPGENLHSTLLLHTTSTFSRDTTKE